MSWQVLHADCVEQMRLMDEASVDAIVTDPPYGLHFMGKTWDQFGGPTGRDNTTHTKRGGAMHAGQYDFSRNHEFQRDMTRWATEALRVLKPGGHLLAFGGTRTHHRLACAIEDAGFEIRDSLIWLYGSGFPKSLNVATTIDKAAKGHPQGSTAGDPDSPNSGKFKTQATEGKRGRADKGQHYGAGPGQFMAEQGEKYERDLVPEAEQWNGWGTALKPGHEPIVMARKPLVGTVAANVQQFGTGALNIDATRIEAADDQLAEKYASVQTAGPRENAIYGTDARDRAGAEPHAAGRWPANVVLDTGAAIELDRQSAGVYERKVVGSREGPASIPLEGGAMYDDAGGASRFFATFPADEIPFRYCAKASRGERNAGLDGFEEREAHKLDGGDFRPEGRNLTSKGLTHRNIHPTVKPIALMCWLCRLVTPPGGLILDPFLGSGTTGIAAILEGFDFIGIEREPEYVEIAKARIAHWAAQPKQLELA